MIQPVGYLKLHRELYHKPIWKQSTPEQKVVLLTLLAMAWFKPNEWEWKGHKFKTKPGQFITSINSIMIDCGKGISIQNVRSSLKRFEKLEFLTNESTKTGRLITIANWEVYQSEEINPTKQPTKTQQRGNKDPTPKEERKKEIKKKEYTDLFEELFSKYPNSKSKRDTFNNYTKRLKEYTHDQLEMSVDNYIKEIKNKGITFIYTSNNFFGNKAYFEDYLKTQEPEKSEGYNITSTSDMEVEYFE